MTTPPRKTEDDFTVERGHLAAPHIPLGRMTRRGEFFPTMPRKTKLALSIAIVLRWWRAGVGR